MKAPASISISICSQLASLLRPLFNLEFVMFERFRISAFPRWRIWSSLARVFGDQAFSPSVARQGLCARPSTRPISFLIYFIFSLFLLQQLIRRERQISNSLSRGVENRVGNRRRNAGGTDFAESSCANRRNMRVGFADKIRQSAAHPNLPERDNQPMCGLLDLPNANRIRSLPSTPDLIRKLRRR